MITSVRKKRIYLLDGPILNIDISVERLVVIDNLSSFDDQTVALETERMVHRS